MTVLSASRGVLASMETLLDAVYEKGATVPKQLSGDEVASLKETLSAAARMRTVSGHTHCVPNLRIPAFKGARELLQCLEKSWPGG
jgi:hypothetical protein